MLSGIWIEDRPMLRKPLLSLLMLMGAPALFLACSDDSEEPKPFTALIIDRESLDYGELEVGQTSPEQLFTVRNASPNPVESVSVSVVGSGFTITANTCERFLDAGMECEVRVKFTPPLAGNYDARLKVEGSLVVDQTVLKGKAFTWVEVTSVPEGVRVIAGDNEWSCSEPCRMPVRTGQLTFRTAPEGYPAWEGACEVNANNGCLLRTTGPKAISLRSLTPLFQWQVKRDYDPSSIATAPNGDILLLDNAGLTRLSGTGQVLWTRPMPGTSKMALDGEGRIYVMDYRGRVTQHAQDGQQVWAYVPGGASPGGQVLAVSANGRVYALVAYGSYDTEQTFNLIALSPEGTERWNLPFNEAQFNTSGGMGVDAEGQVYLSGNAHNRETPGEPVFVKSYFRKYSPEGVRLWSQDNGWYSFAVGPTGEMSALSYTSSEHPGGFALYWLGADGQTRWNALFMTGPGVVDTQNFTSTGTLLLGGHETRTGGNGLGRGWFSVMNPQTRTLGPVTYVDSSAGSGTRIVGLALLPSGNVVVAGGTGNYSSSGSGFVRMYDARVLTGP